VVGLSKVTQKKRKGNTGQREKRTGDQNGGSQGNAVSFWLKKTVGYPLRKEKREKSKGARLIL